MEIWFWGGVERYEDISIWGRYGGATMEISMWGDTMEISRRGRASYGEMAGEVGGDVGRSAEMARLLEHGEADVEQLRGTGAALVHLTQSEAVRSQRKP